MNAPVSRITSKAQTVIPKAVRDKLERAKTEAEDDPFATFSEWSSKADEDAYGSL